MSTTIRYLLRFLLSILVGTALTLCLISVFRLVYVHCSLINAMQYETHGRADLVARELRLAYVWAPAYPSLQAPVRRLYQDAGSRAGSLYPVPALPPRSFSAPLPPLEKALIPADLLINAVYGMFRPVRGAVIPPDSVAVTEFRPSPIPPANGSRADETVVRSVIAEQQPPRRTAPAGAARPVESATPPAPLPPPRDEPRPPPIAPDKPADTEPAPEAIWGVVMVSDAPIYNRSGTRVRTVPAGSLVDVTRIQTVQSGDVVHGTVWSRDGNFPNMIMRLGDVEIYRGAALASTTRQQRELASKRAELIASMEARRQKLAGGNSNSNPHQQEYRKVLMEYKAFEDEAEKLKAEFDSATGGRRMDLANRLRILKNEQATLMPRYNDLKKKRDNWERKNREQRSSTDPGGDEIIQNLMRQIEEISEQLFGGRQAFQGE